MQLEDFEKEYYSEINSEVVSVEDLEKLGVSKKTLSKEVFLRNIYGDEIIKEIEQAKQTKGAKKSIVHLTEEELGLKSEFSNIYDSIDNASFDSGFDILGVKLDEESEE